MRNLKKIKIPRRVLGEKISILLIIKNIQCFIKLRKILKSDNNLGKKDKECTAVKNSNEKKEEKRKIVKIKKGKKKTTRI